MSFFLERTLKKVDIPEDVPAAYRMSEIKTGVLSMAIKQNTIIILFQQSCCQTIVSACMWTARYLYHSIPLRVYKFSFIYEILRTYFQTLLSQTNITKLGIMVFRRTQTHNCWTIGDKRALALKYKLGVGVTDFHFVIVYVLTVRLPNPKVHAESSNRFSFCTSLWPLYNRIEYLLRCWIALRSAWLDRQSQYPVWGFAWTWLEYTISQSRDQFRGMNTLRRSTRSTPKNGNSLLVLRYGGANRTVIDHSR